MAEIFLNVQSPLGSLQVPLTDRLTIGRSRHNNLPIGDIKASRFHCVIERTPDGLLLRDLQSSNGTLLNGQRVQNAVVDINDVITIGATRLTLVTERAPAAGQPAQPAAPAAPATSPPAQNRAIAALETLDEMDVLDDDDVIHDDLEVLDVPGARPEPIAMDDDFESAEATILKLRQIAEAIPQRAFDIDAIELVGTRGKSLNKGGTTVPSDAVAIFRLVLLICFRSHASDIHLEPRADEYLIRIRVDGNILDLAPLNTDLGIKFSAQVKVLCELDTTQRNIVQEGHFAARAPLIDESRNTIIPNKTRRVDYRVSFVPTLYGQKLVIRIFDTANAPHQVEDLQFPAFISGELAQQLGQSAGIILTCGPTGSGKTTTLYALIRSSGPTRRNILTIEDPVEVQIEGTTQLPVDEESGKTFASLLRSALRQDPDVIMVGEIRDAETARIALQAAITGHQVFSTLHTRDTVGTVFRLLDLGIEPFMIAQGLSLIIAQRLVRKLCNNCRRAVPLTAEDRARLGPAAEHLTTIFAPIGCPKCLNSGFAGRRAIFEFLPVTPAIRERITHNPTPASFHEHLATTNFIPLQRAGDELVIQGLTSFEEVDRAIGQ